MKMTKYKLSELVEVTRGASLSGQFYAEEGKLIRLTLGNFNMNEVGSKKTLPRRICILLVQFVTSLYLTKVTLSLHLPSNHLVCWELLHVFPKVASIFKVRM